MASYSDSLLVALKPKRTTCSTLSPVGGFTANRCRLLSVWRPHRHRVSTGLFYSGRHRAAGFLQGSLLRLAPFSKVSACTECHIRSIPLPNGPSFRTYQVCELCPGVEDRSAPQWGEPKSMVGAFGRPSGGLEQLVRGGCIWFLRRSRTC